MERAIPCWIALEARFERCSPAGDSEPTMSATVSFALLLIAAGNLSLPTALLTGFHRSPYFGEQVREQWVEGDVRVLVNLPADYDPARPTQLVIYATPNGITIEQTLGCAPGAGVDWQFDIQHVAAQVRRY